MKILILGSAGSISRQLTKQLLTKTAHTIVLYARNASSRLALTDSRVTLIDGDFLEVDKLVKAMQGVDLVYLNDMADVKATQTIVQAMEKAQVTRLIGATVLGIYDEVPGAFGAWNKRMVGAYTKAYQTAAQVVENSPLDYTLLRLTWLYDQAENAAYMLTQKGEPFVGAQVTREAVAQLILDLIADHQNYHKASLGVSEPNTDWAKPAFY
ncbi:MAG: NAD(P)H-binding protein [Enterococcus sp.]